MEMRRGGPGRGSAALATLLAILAVASSCRPQAGKAPTPGPDEARRAWNAVAGPSPTPRPTQAQKPIDLGFLKPLFEFIAKNRLPIAILGGTALLGFCLWLLIVARRRSLPGRISHSASKEIKAAVKATLGESEKSPLLYARALEAARAGDYSLASVFLRRARVAELAETGALPARYESGDAEIARAAESSGAVPGAYRRLARAADSVLFGRKSVTAEAWESLIALCPAPGGRR